MNDPVSTEQDRFFGELTDEQIIARVIAGETPLFELIMRRYNQRLFRAARAVLRKDSDAEDVVQETYLRAFEQLATFQGQARLSTWLTRIAVNRAIDWRRRESSASLREQQSMDSQGRSRSGLHLPNPESAASNQELRELLVAMIDTLPEPLRVVFVLRAVEGLDTAETAECLQISESNVKIRLYRARAGLRDSIDDRLGEETRQLHQFDGERCNRIVAHVFERLSPDSDTKNSGNLESE